MRDGHQQREALVKIWLKRVAHMDALKRSTKEGLYGDVHGQSYVRVHARLQDPRGSGRIIAAIHVCVRGQIQAQRGLEVQEYGRGWLV